MFQKFKEHIDNHFSFLNDKKLLIAISGGVDSVALTHLLDQLNFKISLAHCNFNLRDLESDKDEIFVKKLGTQLALKTFTTSFNTNNYANTNKTSTQIAARELRYNWFRELATKYQFDYILTAHHADDNLETFLINLTRGTGLEGLTGIPTINNNIVRPLLAFSRNEIEEFAIKENIEWREDISNSSTKYTRNKIRHQIIPVLKEINPNLLESFKSTTVYLQQSQQIINNSIKNIKETVFSTEENGVLKIDITKIKSLKNYKAYLYELLNEYRFTEWNDIEHLLNAQSGKQVYSKTHRLLKDRNFLFLSKIEENNLESTYFLSEDSLKITIPIYLSIEEAKNQDIKNKKTIYIDKEKISFPLTLRKWKDGDYFYPLGMEGKKKLSKFFKDEKYSLLEKENTWLLCSKNEIIWVIGKRQDYRFLSTPKTKHILKIST